MLQYITHMIHTVCRKCPYMDLLFLAIQHISFQGCDCPSKRPDSSSIITQLPHRKAHRKANIPAGLNGVGRGHHKGSRHSYLLILTHVNERQLTRPANEVNAFMWWFGIKGVRSCVGRFVECLVANFQPYLLQNVVLGVEGRVACMVTLTFTM